VPSAKGWQFNASLGQRPRIHGTQRKAPALKARASSVCIFRIPYALVTLQTERALNLASRIEHAPSPQSSPRKRGEAEWCPRIAYTPSKNSCCFVPAKPEEHIGNSHKLSQIERLLDFSSPFPKGRGLR
jgi:hypothetical protein